MKRMLIVFVCAGAVACASAPPRSNAFPFVERTAATAARRSALRPRSNAERFVATRTFFPLSRRRGLVVRSADTWRYKLALACFCAEGPMGRPRRRREACSRSSLPSHRPPPPAPRAIAPHERSPSSAGHPHRRHLCLRRHGEAKRHLNCAEARERGCDFLASSCAVSPSRA